MFVKLFQSCNGIETPFVKIKKNDEKENNPTVSDPRLHGHEL